VSVPLPLDIAELEDRLENGTPLRGDQRKLLLRLWRGEVTPAGLRREAKSMQAAQKAEWILVCVVLHEVGSPPGPKRAKREAAVHHAMDAYGVSRSYVYRMLNQLGPEREARMRLGCATWIAATTGRVPRHVLSTEEAVSVDRYFLEFMR
jgi:hypothetical protein